MEKDEYPHFYLQNLFFQKAVRKYTKRICENKKLLKFLLPIFSVSAND